MNAIATRVRPAAHAAGRAARAIGRALVFVTAWQLVRHFPRGVVRAARGLGDWLTERPRAFFPRLALTGIAAALFTIGSIIATVIAVAIGMSVLGIAHSTTVLYPWLAFWAWLWTVGIGAYGRSQRPSGATQPATLTREQINVAQALEATISAVRNDDPDKAVKLSKLQRTYDRDGQSTGREMIVHLPFGAVFDQIKPAVIAQALGTRRDRVTITEGAHPGIARIFVADKAPSELPPAAWPLANANRFDLCRPIPIGQTPDGKPATLQLFDRDNRGALQSYHVLLTGMSRYGKSSLLQLILSAAAMDSRAVLDVTVLGQDTDDFIAITPALTYLTVNASLEDLHAQLDRGLAHMAARPGHPYVLVIDEAQFHLGEKGDAAARKKLGDLLSSAGKTGLAVIAVTQEPTKDYLDPGIARKPQNRVSFRQSQPEAAQRAMGSGMTDATDPSKFGGGDKGLAAVIGEDGFNGRVKTPLLAPDLVARIARAHPREKLHTPQEPPQAPFPAYGDRPHLHVVQDPQPPAETISDHVRQAWPPAAGRSLYCNELVGLLAERYPRQYAGWEASDLTRALKDHGVEVKKIRIGDTTGTGVTLAAVETAGQGGAA